MTRFYKGDTVRAHWLEGHDHTMVLPNDFRLPESADFGPGAAFFGKKIKARPWTDYCLMTLMRRPLRNKIRNILHA
jgi:hypothetical protein